MFEYVRNYLAAVLGYQPATRMRVVDPVEVVMKGGISIIDSGWTHPLVQHFEHFAIRKHFADVPTIDLGVFRRLKALYWNPSNYKPETGFLDASQVSLIEKMSGTAVREGGKVSVSFEDEIRTAILTAKRTVIDLYDAYVEKEFIETLVSTLKMMELAVAEISAGGGRLPILVIDLLPDFENDEVHDLIRRINRHGCGVMLFRLVYVATPTTKLMSDLHIVERYPLRNKASIFPNWENEAYLATGERVLVKTERNIEQPLWIRGKSNSVMVPSMADYEAGLVEPFGQLQVGRV